MSGEQDLRDHGRGQSGLVKGVAVGGEPADPGVFASADAVLDPGMDAVAGVDVGGLAAPALRGGRQVGDPQLVPVPVPMLEKREPGAGLGPLAASEDPHGAEVGRRGGDSSRSRLARERLSDKVSDNHHGQRWTPADLHGRPVPG